MNEIFDENIKAIRAVFTILLQIDLIYTSKKS